MRWSKVLRSWVGLVRPASCSTAQNDLQSPLGSSLTTGNRLTETTAAVPDTVRGQRARTRALAKQSCGEDAHAAVTSRRQPAAPVDRSSTFMAKDAPLFSSAADYKPWPALGSEEAKRQAAFDAQREREVKRSMIICQGC